MRCWVTYSRLSSSSIQLKEEELAIARKASSLGLLVHWHRINIRESAQQSDVPLTSEHEVAAGWIGDGILLACSIHLAVAGGFALLRTQC